MQERSEREALLDRIAAIVDERGLMTLTFEHRSHGSTPTRPRRLLFESLALGLRDERYRAFVHGVDHCLAFATLSMAVHRGALTDFCAPHARAGVDAAMQLWIDATTSEMDERDD